jgi:hypothetical protein
MKFRNTLILLVVLILVGGYVYYSQKQTANQPSPSAADVPTVAPVLEIDPAQVLTITVQGPAGETRLSRTDANALWQMDSTAPMTSTVSGLQEADPERAANILSIATLISANRTLTDVTDLSSFGLATPQWSVTIEGAGQAHYTIYLGDKNPDGASCYAMRAGYTNVYLIPAYVGDDLRGLVDNPPVKPTPTPTATPTPPMQEATATPGVAATPLPAISPTATPSGTPVP